MINKTVIPGVSRSERLSDEGLQRLEKHLSSGPKMSNAVLLQWIRRYGDPARELIQKHGYLLTEPDNNS
ncbi:MAG: hypothetical protein OQK73_07900 [Gammaproteobacteria bacterium]|nr:hypothetical protein [Gammaproteobacteria bacterium]